MTIVFNGYFPGGAKFDDYFRVEFASASSITNSSAPSTEGVSGFYEYVLDPAGSGDTVAKITATRWPGVGARMELRPFEKDFGETGGPVYGRNWYAVWYYFPSSIWDNRERANGVGAATNTPSAKHIFLQHHQWFDEDDTAASPPIAIFAYHGWIWFANCYDTGDPSLTDFPNGTVYERIMPLPMDRWMLLVADLTAAYDNNGNYDLYIDRRKLLSIPTSPNMYNNVLGPYTKFGNYGFPAATAPNTEISIIYTKGCKIGDSSSSHEEVSGVSSLGYAVGRQAARS